MTVFFLTYLPMIHKYSVFDEFENVVKISQVSYVDYLPSGKKENTTTEELGNLSSILPLMKTLRSPRHCTSSWALTWWGWCDCWSRDWDFLQASGPTTELAGLDLQSCKGKKTPLNTEISSVGTEPLRKEEHFIPLDQHPWSIYVYFYIHT